MPTEVVVYSDPLQYLLWHDGLPYAAPIVCALVAFLVTFLAHNWLRATLQRRKRYAHWRKEGQSVASLCLTSSVAFVLVLCYML